MELAAFNGVELSKIGAINGVNINNIAAINHIPVNISPPDPPPWDAAVFIDVGTLTREQDVNGTITVYKTSDDSQVGLIAQVIGITSDTQYYFNNIPEEYYIVWNLVKRTNGTPILTSINWTEGLTFTMGSGQNSGNWKADTDFTVNIT